MPNVGVVVGTWMNALLEASGMGASRRGRSADGSRAAARIFVEAGTPAGTKDDFNNIQNWGDPVNSWGWGTFYARAAESRPRLVPLGLKGEAQARQ